MAPTNDMPGLSQAYGQAAPAPMQQNQAPLFNQDLENQAQGGNIEMEPIVQQIMKHLGLMSAIRNRSNQMMIDPTTQG